MSDKKTNNKKLAKSRHKDFNDVLRMVRAEVAPLMVGPSGTGKTSIGRGVAQEMDLPFYFIGAVESTYQIKGFIDANGQIVHTPFRKAYEEGGVFLFDEMDASDPQTLVALHAALDNGYLDAPDAMVEQHPDFHFMASANTWGRGASLQYMGRNALDGATLDRYGFQEIDYDQDFEKKLVEELVGESYLAWVTMVHQARQIVFDLHMRHIVSTRAAVNGAKLLKAEFTTSEAFNRVVLKGMDIDQKTQFMQLMDEKIEVLKKVDPSGIIERLNIQIKDLENLVDQASIQADEITSARKKMMYINEELDKASTSNAALSKISDKVEGLSQRLEGELPENTREKDKQSTRKPNPRTMR